MIKKVKAIIKLALSAGNAKPNPPIGPVLGQYGINIKNFCTEYNNKTINQNGLIIPVKITIYDDKSYTFILKSPPTSILLLKYANIKKGSAFPNKQFIGKLTKDQLLEIAKIKLQDLNTLDLQKAILSIIGTAKNLGIIIEN
jgi:large subunit ribosomal protein L11